jgi:hypothetical protein
MSFEKVWHQFSTIAMVSGEFPEPVQCAMYKKVLSNLDLSKKLKIAMTQTTCRTMLTDMVDTYLIELFMKTQKEKMDNEAANAVEKKVTETKEQPVNQSEEPDSDMDAWEKLHSSILEQLGSAPILPSESWADFDDRAEKTAVSETNRLLFERNSQQPPLRQQQQQPPLRQQQQQPPLRQQQQQPPPHQQQQQPPLHQQQLYSNMACGFPNLPPTSNRHTFPTQSNNHGEKKKGPPVNSKKHFIKSATCELWFAGCCRHGEDCWFLHDTDADSYPIKWGPRNGFYTPKKDSDWRHSVSISGDWIHENREGNTPTGEPKWVVKSLLEFRDMMVEYANTRST